MNNNEDFLKEIKSYSLDDLELIYETQKDLYTDEEMAYIRRQIERRKETVNNNEKIKKLLPKEIICSKCDGPNSFENDICIFCGAKLDKSKYYSLDYYENRGEDQNADGEGNAFRYIISFLIPLVGYILGAILLSKNDADERTIGKTCIILGILSTLIFAFVWYAVVGALLK